MGKTRLDFASLADGALMDLFDKQVRKVMDNIKDPNTAPKSKRKVTLEVEFAPDESRKIVSVVISTHATLSHIKPISTAAILEEENGKLVPYVQSSEDSDVPGNVISFAAGGE
jgi:hypothetical protein